MTRGAHSLVTTHPPMSLFRPRFARAPAARGRLRRTFKDHARTVVVIAGRATTKIMTPVMRMGLKMLARAAAAAPSIKQLNKRMENIEEAVIASTHTLGVFRNVSFKVENLPDYTKLDFDEVMQMLDRMGGARTLTGELRFMKGLCVYALKKMGQVVNNLNVGKDAHNKLATRVQNDVNSLFSRSVNLYRFVGDALNLGTADHAPITEYEIEKTIYGDGHLNGYDKGLAEEIVQLKRIVTCLHEQNKDLAKDVERHEKRVQCLYLRLRSCEKDADTTREFVTYEVFEGANRAMWQYELVNHNGCLHYDEGLQDMKTWIEDGRLTLPPRSTVATTVRV